MWGGYWDSNPGPPEPQSGALTNCAIPTISTGPHGAIRERPAHGRENGVPAGTRTQDLLLRRQLLYPAELQAHKNLERVMGVEPTYPAWKAGILPMNYTRMTEYIIAKHSRFVKPFLYFFQDFTGGFLPVQRDFTPLRVIAPPHNTKTEPLGSVLYGAGRPVVEAKRPCAIFKEENLTAPFLGAGPMAAASSRVPPFSVPRVRPAGSVGAPRGKSGGYGVSWRGDYAAPPRAAPP